MPSHNFLIILTSWVDFFDNWSTQSSVRPCNAALETRVAQSAGIGGLDPSIAKDLIDSEDPKHTLFCREIAFVAIYALFRDDISIL